MLTDGLDLRPRNGLSLFAGGGGLDMGLMLAEPGFHTRCFVEWEKYPQNILIAAQEAGYFAPAPIWDDITSFDGRPLRGAIDTILAGYPCQGESYAGKRMLENDPRWMWPQVERLAKEIQPRWLFLENVRGHVTGGAETVLRRLHDMGFKTSTGLITAAETGAPHERCRWFTVAYSRENSRALANASSARGPARYPEQDAWSQRQSDQSEYSRGPLAAAFQPGWERHARNVLSPCESGWVNTGTSRSAATDGAGLFPPAPSDMPGWSAVLAMAPDLAPTVAFGDLARRAGELAQVVAKGGIGVIAAGAAFLKKAFSRKFAYSALEGTIGADGFDGYARDHFKGGLFRSDKDIRKALDYDLKTGLSNQAKGLTETLLGMSEALGRGRDALKDYKGHFVSILTSGRSQEQIQKDLARGFETASNQMSELILGTSKWSKAGESATETLTRLSTSLLQVNDAFDLLGLSGFKKSLQGADMASGLVDDFGGSEAMTNAVSAYWTGFYSDAERQETTIRRLSAEFKKLGLAMPQSREEFRSLVEGIDRTSASGRKLYADLLKLSGGLGQVLDPRAGISQGVAKQLEAIGKTVADQIEVSRSMAADARASAELWHRTAAKLRDFQDGLLNSGLSGASSAQTAAALRGRYLSALERARGGDTDAAAELPGLAREYLQSARDSAGSALEFNRIAAQVQAEIHQMTALADAAGDADERLADLLDEQTSVLTELGEYLQTANASSKKFGEDVAQYQDRLKALGADIVEASKNPGIAEVSPTGPMSELFGELTGGLSSVKAPMNSLTSMLGKLRDAVNADRRDRNRNAKIAGLQVKGGDAAAAAKRPQEIAEKFNALREKYGVSLHGQKRSISVNKDGQLVTSFDYYGGTPKKLAEFKKALKDEFGTASFGNVVSSANSKASKAAVQAESLRKQIRSMGGIPQFAEGGAHLGGWRIVGERGWELENTGPSRVVSHSDSVAMLDNRQVVRSVEGLAKQVAVQGQRMEMMVRKVAQYLEDWDEVGQPEVRV